MMAVSFEEAREIVLARARPLGVEQVELAQAWGRVLASPVRAAFDLPRFDNSAMDGFGVRIADVAAASPERPARLPVRATVHAGEAAGTALPTGAAVKLLTGAPVPAGVEAVVMREDTEEDDGLVRVRRAATAGENIRRRGEEYRAGETVLEAGTWITPPVVGLLATFGLTSVEVYVRPRVAVIVTGKELVQPGERLAAPQIYDANSFSLAGALAAWGLPASSLGRVSDDLAETREALAQALATAEVVLTVGGVSVGEHDWVKEACARCGVETQFWGVAMKPGKPTFFGLGRQGQLVFGLPGNPVAVLVAYHQFVKPALLAVLGVREVRPMVLTAELAAPVRKKRGRLEFLRGWAEVAEGRLVVRPTNGQDSHMLGGLASANCLLHVAAEAESLAVGESVRVQFLSWER